MPDNALILCALLGPFIAASLSLAGPRRLAEVWQYAAAVVSLLASAGLAARVLAGDQPGLTLVPLAPGLDLALRVDALGITFATLASGLWLAASVYSSGYVRAEDTDHRPRYFACFAGSIGAALGVAFAENLLTFLLFYELLTLMTYPLVVHKQTPEAIAAGRRYLTFALSAGMVLLVAIAWTWHAAGTIDFRGGGILAGKLGAVPAAVLFVLFLSGCGVKAAIMPLHSWLPAAMVAPTPVSALLHAVAVVKAGVFGCIRIVGYVFGPEAIAGTPVVAVAAAFCGFTILAGSLLALRQDQLKRRLAYSTIVQLSLIVLGALLMSPIALTGSVLHLVNHGVAKITLFFCAGAIIATNHIDKISQMKGLGHRMPWTFGAFTVASLGLIGMPGLCGFISKLFLVRGAWQSGEVVYLVVLLVASLFSASYLLPIIYTAYFDPPDGDHGGHAVESRRSMVGPLVATAVLVVLFGLVPAVINIQHDLAAGVAQQVFGGAP